MSTARPIPFPAQPFRFAVSPEVLAWQLARALAAGGLKLTHDPNGGLIVSSAVDIEVTPCPVGYQAIDKNTYDDALDASRRGCAIGTGKTRQAAIEDLLEQLCE